MLMLASSASDHLNLGVNQTWEMKGTFSCNAFTNRASSFTKHVNFSLLPWVRVPQKVDLLFQAKRQSYTESTLPFQCSSTERFLLVNLPVNSPFTTFHCTNQVYAPDRFLLVNLLVDSLITVFPCTY